MLNRLWQSLSGRRVPPGQPAAGGDRASVVADAEAGTVTDAEDGTKESALIPPVTRRVLAVTLDPVMDERSGRTLLQTMGWNDPVTLAAGYAEDVQEVSRGFLRYEVVEHRQYHDFAPLVDGFKYDADTFMRCWQARAGFHQPDGVDYHALLRQLEVVERVNDGEIDELWVFGHPWGGFYESIMVGPDAFWCNAPPLPAQAQTGHGRVRLPQCSRRFVVMGFNYERGVDCMLEDLGHRTESMMTRLYDGRRGGRREHGGATAWEHFTRYEQVAPGHASVGNVHFAPNSRQDYDWGNPRPVLSDCDDWLRYPHLTGERREVTCRDWGNGDMRLHHLWWFERLPHAPGERDGVLNNWWAYVADANQVP